MTAIGRTVWPLLAVLLFWLMAGHAYAATYPDQFAAYSGCLATADSNIAGQGASKLARRGPDTCKQHSFTSPVQQGYWCRFQRSDDNGGTFYYVDCGEPRHSYTANTCSSRTPLGSSMVSLSPSASVTTCSQNCSYQPMPGSVVGVQLGDSPTMFYQTAGWVPSGDTCVPGEGQGDPDGQKCVQQGSLTQCVKPDGRQCAVSSTGKEFCWQPTEAGTKAAANEAATKAPANANVNPPNNPPKNGGDWQQGPQGTSSTNSGGTTTNYNISSWVSSYGSSGDGGTGDGEGDGEGDGPGSPGEGVGDLYTPTGKTVASVFQAFRERVGESPIVSAIDSFMTVSVGGGCPVFTVPASDYWNAMTWDAHCSGAFAQALVSIGWVLMAIAAFFAFKMAIS